MKPRMKLIHDVVLLFGNVFIAGASKPRFRISKDDVSIRGTLSSQNENNSNADAAGISPTTTYCQRGVLADHMNGTTYHADPPNSIDSLDDIHDKILFGDEFDGVTAVRLDPGIVTRTWTDMGGKTRGHAILWIPDEIISENRTGSPRLLYVHGGGWATLSPTSGGYAPFGASLARLYSFPVLVIDYTLVPIGNFSVILEEIGAATHFLATHEPIDIVNGDLNSTSDPSKQPPVFVSGDSADAGSAVSALVAQASPSGLPKSNCATLSGGIVYSPSINLEANLPTYYTQLFGVHEDEEALLGDINFGYDGIVKNAQGHAKTYSEDLKDPIANPFYAPSSWLKDMAPISLHVGSDEILQSDSTLFAMLAARAGASWVESHVFDGMWHSFQMYAGGCGSGSKLILAESSLNFSKQFLDDVMSSSFLDTDQNVYCSVNHYEYPSGQDSAQGFKCASSL